MNYSERVFGKCRFSDRVVLPCSWVVDGVCGVDARVCRVEVVRNEKGKG